MKREYVKPMISFEELRLDMPVASGCAKEYVADVKDLLAQGWFNAEYDCNKDQYIVSDELENAFWDDDKLCYYSAVNQAFTS